ncbi:aldehyde dehydrogenase [Gloeocapsa sp. PCC 73106]|uniref:aldehyde dehydrogenase n=1 Tax=Gloeocapsa sp. PCC 73106 TaxID=102232 RepID=UPI0002AB9D55|nr:aldehyde dehydrogenase [Gloeocapsa sp. PCC 73106]ELS00133.1 NAD-dependent aldehyde dehydrogenase [Gloeocapsa sp. PCC 73106]
MLTLTSIPEILQQQRDFFATGKTRDLSFRTQQLSRLKQAISTNQDAILQALKGDLNKPEFEGFFDIIAVTQEIDYALKHIKKWTRPQKVKSDIQQFPSSAVIYPEPLGVVLIVGPWNYPFSLVLTPLVGAIASGNCAILKPSELASHTSKIVTQLISNAFDPSFITVVEGGVSVSQELLQQKFDHIFFTGGTRIGKIVMTAAAQHLTPVTLELGGKSPCIVDTEINLSETAKRIIWGKFINAGQTCIAPDYLLVQESLKEQLIPELKNCIRTFYGENPAQSPDYARIINVNQFDRLVSLLSSGKIILGGESDRDQLYIAPTLIEEVSPDTSLMQEEIFGPILPILTYDTLDEAIQFINSRPKPLALYLFSNNKQKQQQVLKNTSSGGVCFNDTIMQVAVTNLPFGGVGDSGMGNYHGQATFATFSHYKSVLKKGFRFDLNWRYPPYAGKLERFKKMFKTN